MFEKIGSLHNCMDRMKTSNMSDGRYIFKRNSSKVEIERFPFRSPNLTSSELINFKRKFINPTRQRLPRCLLSYPPLFL